MIRLIGIFVGQECLIEVPKVQCIELIREVPKEVPNTDGRKRGRSGFGGKTCFFLLGGGEEEVFLFFCGGGLEIGEIDGMMDLEELDMFLC